MAIFAKSTARKSNRLTALSEDHPVRQDLSIAGKRKGLAGERSGLYMEQIRIIREMREHDRKTGRTGQFIRPRYMVWENVVGAQSSQQGRDFAAVLEEAIRVAEPEAPDIQVRDKGWPTWGGYRDVDGRWSVAWRVLDAQWWGVPQRRRRIALVADFGGTTAHEILFNAKGVYGHPETGREAGKRSSRRTEEGASCTVRIRGGCDGGGKGALVQTEKSSTLGSGNDQTLFARCLTPYDTQKNRVYGADGIWPTLPAQENSGQNRQSVFCVPINDKATRFSGGGDTRKDDGAGNGLGVGHDGEPSPTLTAADRHGVYCAGFKLGNSEQARSIGYSEELAPTLNAECGGNKPAILDMSHANDAIRKCGGCKPAVIAFAQNQREEVRNVGDKAVSLAAEVGMHCQTFVALDMSHANDVIRECGDVVPTLQIRMGTGGNQVPLTYAWERSDSLAESDIACTQSARQGKSATDLVVSVDCRNGTENGDVNGTLQAKSNGGTSYNLNNVCRERGIVRRLTPMECERLQGFPDGWTDIGAWTDEKGKLHKESSDSARYKALGNSIALPPWKWVLKRLCAQYEHDATMGSLFDGIGGFPLIWMQLNGWNSVKWASEIEPFCIAVTKRHFGDENGAGDAWRHLLDVKK